MPAAEGRALDACITGRSPVSPDDLAVMRRIDELHLAYAVLRIAPDGGGVAATTAGW